MVNKKFFTKLRSDYAAYNQGRNEIIIRSRDILKFSKAAIFACHRSSISEAKKSLEQAEKVIGELNKKISGNKSLQHEGSLHASLEEYAEAKLFYNYLKTGQVGEISVVKLSHETYIGALSDFTGELVRVAISLATQRKTEEVEKIKTIVEEIMEQFIKFDLLSNLRNKYDSARKNLRSLEEILYDLSISERK